MFAANETVDTITDWIGIPLAILAVALFVWCEVQRERTGVLDRRLLVSAVAATAVVTLIVAARFVLIPNT